MLREVQPHYTLDFKNDTSCSLLGIQTFGVQLGVVNPVSE